MANVTVRKRGNVYEYRFDTAKIDGKRKQLSKSGFKTKREAIEEGNKAFFIYNNAGNTFKPSDISYSDYLDIWLNDYCKINLSYNTISTYETVIRLYIKPKLGMYRLSSIRSSSINTFINEIIKEYNFSKGYMKTILKVVKGSFSYACNIDYLQYNPARDITIPDCYLINNKEKHNYNQNEVEMILERFKDNEVFTIAFVLAMLTGMRTGEVFGLTWDNIDFDNNEIIVEKKVFCKTRTDGNRWYFGPTKNRGKKRYIPMGDYLRQMLIKYKNNQEEYKRLFGKDYHYYYTVDEETINQRHWEKRIIEGYTDKEETRVDLIFVKENGKYSGTDYIKYPLKIIREELKITNSRFYDNRSTLATKMKESGVSMTDIMNILGHDNERTTEKYYIKTRKDVSKTTMDFGESILLNEKIKDNLNRALCL